MNHTPSIQRRITMRLIVLGLGIVILLGGFATLLGYLLDLSRFYQWDSRAVGMAPNTGLLFMFTGLGFIVVANWNWLWRTPGDA